MDYENEYKKAREIAKKNYEAAQDLCEGSQISVECFKNTLTNIFPELKEGEDDRLKRNLIGYIKGISKNEVCEETKDSWIAWLEKQGKIDKTSYEIAEKEKREFVGDGFIRCYADFQDFKEGETYWLEYVGNDNYNVRSDNLLGKTYHITPCQLYTIFKKQTWLEKQGETNPYSGVSFKYNGHTWGMCARDNGVEIIFDGELKDDKPSLSSWGYG